MDHGSHSLYLMFEWLGSYPKAVTASAKNFQEKKYDTEDYFSAVYEFEGGMASVHLSWAAGTRKTLYTLHGTKGALKVEDDQLEISVQTPRESESISHKADWITETLTIPSHWMDSSHTTWFHSLFDQFKRAIDEGDYYNNEIRDAYFCIKSIVKSYDSIQNDSVKIHMSPLFPNIF